MLLNYDISMTQKTRNVELKFVFTETDCPKQPQLFDLFMKYKNSHSIAP